LGKFYPTNKKKIRQNEPDTQPRGCEGLTEEKVQTELLIHQAENATALWGVLAGLTFTASVLIFSFRTSLPLSDPFLTLTLITTILFVYSASFSYDASRHVVVGDMKIAESGLALAEGFGFVGFVMTLADTSFIAFSVGWQYGVIVIAVIVLGFMSMLFMRSKGAIHRRSVK